MANSRNRRKQDSAFLVLVVVVGGIYALLSFIGNNMSVAIPLIIVIAIVVIIAAVVLPRRTRQQVRDRACEIVEQHSDQLAKRRAQLVRQDPYGKPLLEKWHSEVDYFITEHIRPYFTPKQQSVLEGMRQEITRHIIGRAETLTQQAPIFRAFSESMSPTEFEAFCAEQLRSCGWDAQLTRTTGDQGVDVIAEKSGLRVVLQCKLYSGSVGNSAIQEIVAGKAFERADHGAVVSNNRYTPAAEQLAAANGVLLLHYSDLPKLETLLQPKFAAVAAPSHAVTYSEPPSTGSLPSLSDHPQSQLLEEVLPVEENPQTRSRFKIAVIVSLAVIAIGSTFYVVRNPSDIRKQQITSFQYTTYANDRFGFRIEYPSTFAVQRVADNSGGMTATSSDGKAMLTAAGGNNSAGLSTKECYDEAIRNVNGTLGYHRLGGTWFVVTWTDGDQVVYRKMFVGSGSLNSFTFAFPSSQRTLYEQVVTHMEKSFKPGALDQPR